MTKKQGKIAEIKKRIIPTLKKYRVSKASIFGSIARGDAIKASDVDILIQPPKEMGLEFVGMKLELEKILKKRVDVITYKGIHPYIKKSILESEVRIL